MVGLPNGQGGHTDGGRWSNHLVCFTAAIFFCCLGVRGEVTLSTAMVCVQGQVKHRWGFGEAGRLGLCMNRTVSRV